MSVNYASFNAKKLEAMLGVSFTLDNNNNGTQYVDNDMTMNGSIWNKVGTSLYSTDNGGKKENTTTDNLNKHNAGQILSSAKSSIKEAKAGANECKAAKIQGTQDKQQSANSAQQMTVQAKQAVTQINTNTNTITKSKAEQEKIAAEIESLVAERNEIIGGDNTGMGEASAFSLTLAGANKNTQTNAANPNGTTSLTAGQNPAAANADTSNVDTSNLSAEDKAKVDSINSKIDSNVATSANLSKTITKATTSTTSTKAKIYALGNQGLSGIQTAKTTTTNNIQKSDTVKQIGQTAQMIGGAAVSLGTALSATVFGAAIGGPLITYGGYATAAGSITSGIASATSGDLTGAISSISQSGAAIAQTQASVKNAGTSSANKTQQTETQPQQQTRTEVEKKQKP